MALAIQQNRNVLVLEFHPQRMPDVGADRRIDVLDRDAAPVRGVVKRHVVLQRVGARDIIVVAVLPAPQHPARLVLLSAQRLEFHFDETARERNVLFDAPWKRAPSSLLQHVFPAGRRRVGADGPPRIAGTCYTRLPTLRECPGARAIEVLGLGLHGKCGGASENGKHNALHASLLMVG